MLKINYSKYDDSVTNIALFGIDASDGECRKIRLNNDSNYRYS